MSGAQPADSQEISRRQLIEDLERLGVRPGDHLGLGVSIKAIGPLNGGAETLIRALLDAVGETGTLMIPAFTKSFGLHQAARSDELFDPGTSLPYTGVCAGLLCARTDSQRSTHPTNSVVAVGRLARSLVDGHGPGAPAYSPYSKLASIGGKILSIGIGDNLVAIRHQAQFLAGLLDVIPPRKAVKYLDEKRDVRLFVRKDEGGCIKKLPLLVQEMRERNLVTDGLIGHARSVLVPAKESLEYMTSALRERPLDYLCDDFNCLWCRGIDAAVYASQNKRPGGRSTLNTTALSSKLHYRRLLYADRLKDLFAAFFKKNTSC